MENYLFLIFRPTLACLRTVACGYALTMTFVPGDRHLIVGMKDGKMLIVDIASGDILEEISAHSKELWSITLFPDMVTKRIRKLKMSINFSFFY